MKVWLVTVETFWKDTNEPVSTSNEIFATEKLAKQYSEEVFDVDRNYATTAEYEELPVYTNLPL